MKSNSGLPALWVVEAKVIRPIKNNSWQPCLGFPNIRGVYRIRSAARQAAKEMQMTNQYNQHGHLTTIYRAAKYLRAGGG